METTPLHLTAELLLLLHGDESGKPLVDSRRRRVVTAGAAVCELAVAGTLALDEDVPARRARLRATGGPVPSDHLLEALRRADGHKPKDALARIGGGQDFRWRADAIRLGVMTDLADQGVVELVERRVLGLVPVRRWPLRRPEVEAAVRTRLADALDGATPDARTGCLVSLAHSVKLLPKLFPEREKKAVVARGRQIAETQWYGDAVTKAIQEINTVVVAAMGAAVVAGSGNG